MEVRTTCRSCDSGNLKMLLSFGEMPLADALVDGRSGHPEDRYGLTAVFCQDCCLVQILETVEPEILYGTDYPYYSSFSPYLLRHSADNANQLIATRHLNQDSLVVELASNDGYLLKNFQERGVPVLGIDPASGPARVAQEAGIRTVVAYFDKAMAEEMQRQGIQADVIIGNNVLAHVSDQNSFVGGIATLLKDDGVAVIEVPYVKDLIDQDEFDTIYHEHHCYFSVTALTALFHRHGLTLSDVEHYPIHGGSLRLFVTKNEPVSQAVKTYLLAEEQAGMQHLDYYRDFGQRAQLVRLELRRLLTGLKGAGKRISAYGAAAKGSTLLNFAGVGADLIDFVVDRNVYKQGLLMPGVHIPIREPEALVQEMPDYVLMLSWNFRDEILEQQAAYTRRGGSWIVPIPYPEVLAPAAAKAGV
jgi:SAM-dependent methyltransferase